MEHLKINTNAQIVADYLSPFKEQLEKLYTWKVSKKATDELSKIINVYTHLETDTTFEAEQKIKKAVRNAFLNCNEDYSCALSEKLCKWIVSSWGGIYSKGESPNNLRKELAKGKPITFNRISSKSKILSFRDPENNLIYDSRVAYAINWIILSRGSGDKFFPIPEGRNSKMMAFDMNVLIRLRNLERYKIGDGLDFGRSFIKKRDKNLFIDGAIAYSSMVDLIKQVHNILWADAPDRKELYYTEMLLFSIADRQVYQDIVEIFTLDSLFKNLPV